MCRRLVSCRPRRRRRDRERRFERRRGDSRSPRDGRFIEIVGRYNPQTDPSTIELDEAKVKDWLGKGALPSEAVGRLLKIRNLS